MRFVRLAPALFALAGASVACLSESPFVCQSNPDCISENGVAGICETNGACSFYDATCAPSLRRFADGAASSVASTCVPAGKQCIAKLAMGTSHSCALRTDGAVYCWGKNADGEIGDGTTNDALAPTRVTGLPRAAVQIAADEANTCALLDDGTVWCWGLNEATNLGQCDVSLGSSPVPLEVPTWSLDAKSPGTPTCDATTPFTAKQIALGGEHACAIGTDGSLYCWGENSTGVQGGQCGQDPQLFEDVPGPLPVAFDGAIDVGCGDEYTCVRRNENSVWCFGANDLHELGNGDTAPSFAPVHVAGIADAETLAMDDETPCVVTKTGALFCWGNGTTGIFGTDLASNAPTPTRIANCTSAYGGGTAETICIGDPTGTLQCFGTNDKGQCGTGAGDPNVTAPTPAELVTVSSASIGGDHTCATTTDGSLWCWGADDSGQLGDGHASPIVTIPERIAFPCP